MLNFCHLVLEIESLFPFYCSDLRGNNSVKNIHTDAFSFGPESNYNSQISQVSFQSQNLLNQSKAFNEDHGNGLFNWEKYFKNLENQSNSELKNNLLKYSLKEDKLSQTGGCFVFSAFKNVKCFGS
jgi:hypothetical protein